MEEQDKKKEEEKRKEEQEERTGLEEKGKAGSPRDEGCFDEGEDENDDSGRNGHGGSSSFDSLV